MPRKNRRDKKIRYTDVHNSDDDLFKEIDDERDDEDKDWLNKNY